MTISIALVDDEVNILKSLKRVMSREKWNVFTYDDPEQALIELRQKPIDLIISDYKMPKMNGVEFLNTFKQTNPTAVRLILSGQTDLAGLMGAINSAQVYRFILKPWNDEDLILTIKQAIDYNRLQQENNELAETVRSQANTLKAQLRELRRLEEESPGITQVDWDEQGVIDLSAEFESDDD